MQYPGHDPQFSAVAGFAAQVADGGTARGHGIPLADLTGSMYAAISILAALVERERTGEGQYIDVSMLGAVMSLATTDFSTYFREGRLPAARRGSLTYVRCQDGKYVSLGNAETIFWENFCRALGHEEWIALRGSQGEEYEQMVGEVEQIFLTRPRDEWLALLRDAETCIAPVHDIPGAFADPQVRHIGMALELEHPSEGEVMQLGFPVRFSRTPGAFSSFAPVLGQHTREVLRAAGLAEAELDELEQSGITKSGRRDGVGQRHPSSAASLDDRVHRPRASSISRLGTGVPQGSPLRASRTGSCPCPCPRNAGSRRAGDAAAPPDRSRDRSARWSRGCRPSARRRVRRCAAAPAGSPSGTSW